MSTARVWCLNHAAAVATSGHPAGITAGDRLTMGAPTAIFVSPLLPEPGHTLTLVAMDSFAEKLERYRRIVKGEEVYGEGEGDPGTAFILRVMLNDLVEIVRSRLDADVQGIPLLISMSGLSPLTTILAYEIFKPRRLLVIYSAKGVGAVDEIGDHVVGVGRLKHSEFSHESVDPTDPKAVYQIIKEYLSRSGPDGARVILNITGGKKVMSAAAALAAWQLDLELCYLDGEQDPETNQVVPGSQQLLLLENPINIFGDQELARAAELFHAGAYDDARGRYADLSERLASPGLARLWCAISALYRAWCALDLKALPNLIAATEKALAHPGHRVSAEVSSQMTAQLAYLGRLCGAEPERPALFLSFYLLGDHYARLGRHDFATLFFYRTIEGCLTWRLEQRFGGFRCADPNYALLGADDLDSKYQALSKGLPDKAEAMLPEKVSLIAAAKLLIVVDDELAAMMGLKGKGKLSSLVGLTISRNVSVLAHGYSVVDPAQCRKIGERALDTLVAFWGLHGGETNLENLRTQLRFVEPER